MLDGINMQELDIVQILLYKNCLCCPFLSRFTIPQEVYLFFGQLNKFPGTTENIDLIFKRNDK